MLSLRDAAQAGGVMVVAMTEDGTDALPLLGLTGTVTPPLSDFASAEFVGWCAGEGGDAATLAACPLVTEEPLLVLSARGACTVWVINAANKADHVTTSPSGTVLLGHKPAARPNLLLPEPLGEIREEFTISRATARAYEVRRGDVLQVIDIEGQQCSDFMAFRTAGLEAGLEQRIDSTVTRSLVGGAYPGPGLFDKFYDSDMRPLLNVVQDTCGRHDTFALACTARGYEERGFPGHVNCSDNISEAVASYGVERRPAWPAINFFFNSWIDHSDNRIQVEESWSRPGDYVALQAMDDLVCVSTACPDDVDPINGWNPTDVHVRIYRPDAPIRRAVAHRQKEDARMSLSQTSAFHGRTSQLTEQFQAARDLWLPAAYPGVGTIGEYWACRERVTLQDMSALRKYDVVGPDAERLLQRVTTRNVAKLAQWRGSYTLICDEQGAVIDDGTLFRLAPHAFRWCCGSEESVRHLKANAEGLDVRIRDMQASLPNLALQGPRSRDVLRKVAFMQPHVPSLEALKWFGVTVARLHDREGAPFMLSRSGYTGELGYEIFCDPSDATEIWDTIMAAGEEFGIAPMGAHALEIIRIEAGLAAAGAEFAADVDALEAGLGFAVDFKKDDFIGKAALERNATAPRRQLRGMLLDCDDIPAHGAHVYAGERPVGVVTSATRSPSLERAIAMVRLAVEFAETGTMLEIGQMDGHMKRLTGTVCDIPFIDPRRERARA
ncbi:aminomethyltransferase [Jannaschia pagri]|uniref:Aminomethyltransferase n=1 Tax=Jannaschia pagri TaxID=2829797 RepID=A0ABQ4NLV5_9RHOB|nr:aminomethyltransferase [Jannaschia sp. AI_61]GIT95393.1 aminomethyltransferase [Jannaschia sp. AI_62]